MLGRIVYNLCQKYPNLTISFYAQKENLRICLLTKDGRYGAEMIVSFSEVPELDVLLATKVREIMTCPRK